MVRADLHSHSSVSDGTEPPAAVIRRGAEAGLDVIALTDHDTVAGHREASRALLGKPTSKSALKALVSPRRLREPRGPESVRS